MPSSSPSCVSSPRSSRTRRPAPPGRAPRTALRAPLHAKARLRLGRLVLDYAHAAAEDLRVQERSHELLVRAVPQGLGLVAQRVGVLDRVAAQLAGQTAGDDLLRRPLVDGVGG